MPPQRAFQPLLQPPRLVLLPLLPLQRLPSGLPGIIVPRRPAKLQKTAGACSIHSALL